MKISEVKQLIVIGNGFGNCQIVCVNRSFS